MNKVVWFIFVIIGFILLGYGTYVYFGDTIGSKFKEIVNKEKPEEETETKTCTYVKGIESIEHVSKIPFESVMYSSDLGSLIGIYSDGTYKKIDDNATGSFLNYGYYKNKLYYIVEEYLYSIDYSKSNPVPTKMFALTGDKDRWDLFASSDAVYVGGIHSLYKYAFVDEYWELMLNNNGNQAFLDNKTNDFYYTKQENSNLYKFNLDTKIEELLVEDARISSYNSKEIFIVANEDYNEENNYKYTYDSYIYDLESSSLIESDIPLESAIRYNDYYIYSDGMQLMQYGKDCTPTVLVDLSEKIEDIGSIQNIYLNGNNILVLVYILNYDDEESELYKFNISTKDLTLVELDSIFQNYWGEGVLYIY